MTYLIIIFLTLFLCSTFFAIVSGITTPGYQGEFEPEGYGCSLALISLFVLFALGFMMLGKWLL